MDTPGGQTPAGLSTRRHQSSLFLQPWLHPGTEVHSALVPFTSSPGQFTNMEKAALASLFHLGFAPFLQRDPALPPLPVGQARFFRVTSSSFLRNLSGNGLVQIPSGAFQAWHGLQFLQEL